MIRKIQFFFSSFQLILNKTNYTHSRLFGCFKIYVKRNIFEKPKLRYNKMNKLKRVNDLLKIIFFDT